jgi:predicted metal-dependent hydrolase
MSRQLELKFDAPSFDAMGPCAAAPTACIQNDNGLVSFVRHPRARRYVIRVLTDGSVRVTIPRGGSRKAAAAFADRERRWIETQRRKLEAEQAHRAAYGAEGLTAMRGPGHAPLTEGELIERARSELPHRLNELAKRHGVSVARVSIRNQRWRWGSCSRQGHIYLNWRLVVLPPSVRDYVIIHELMHLKRMDHSPRFWKLVAKACPDYQLARQYLREHSLGP